MSEYFVGLNYSLANEDSWVEHALAPERGQATFAIAGSGSRVLPLLARGPAYLEIADLSEAQLYLTELRIAAVRGLTYEEYLFFLGYRGGILDGTLQAGSRPVLFERLELSAAAREFWRARVELWAPRGFIFLGKWERHFTRLGRIFEKLMRLDTARIFAAQTLAGQREQVARHWGPRRFRGFLRLALSDYVFKRFLYGSHFAGDEEKRTAAEPAWRMVDREFNALFRETLVRKNFFAQMIFLSSLPYEEGFPAEASRAIFEAARGARTEIRYSQGNFLELMGRRPFDFLSLSDTISYLPAPDALGLLSRMHPETPGGACAVIRAFMRRPRIEVVAPWAEDAAAAASARARDCTRVYEFQVLRRKPQPTTRTTR